MGVKKNGEIVREGAKEQGESGEARTQRSVRESKEDSGEGGRE